MRKVNILWAEDKSVSFELYSRVLQRFLKDKEIEAEIIWASTADQVFQTLTNPDPEFDIFITDIDMPNYNGINTVKFLRSRNPNLRMLIVSVHIGEPLIDEVLVKLRNENIVYGYYSHQQSDQWCEAVWSLVSRRAPAILHMSDVHFGRFHALKSALQIERLIEPVLDSIDAQGKIDLVVVTGDLSSEGMRSEFNRADDFLCYVAQKLKLSPSQVVVVPGNHDIFRGDESTERFSRFVDFLNAFYGRLEDPTVALRSFPALFDPVSKMLKIDRSRRVEDSLFSLYVFDAFNSVIIGMNSVIAAEDKRWEQGEINPQQLLSISDSLNRLEPHRMDYFRIALLHHNLFVVPSFTSDGEPERVVRNQGLILNHLITNGVKLVLHGHTHYSIGYKYQPFFLGKKGSSQSSIHVFGTGTLSGEEHARAQSYFHLTLLRCACDDAGKVMTANVTPYRLVDDALPWEVLDTVRVTFD